MKPKPFDWEKFLNKEVIPKEDWKNAGILASDWFNCGVGFKTYSIQQGDLIPMVNNSHAPIDPNLFVLGGHFTYLILIENKEEAKTYLKQIENRVNQLIIEIKENKKRNKI